MQRPRVPPLKRPSVMRATRLPNGIPLSIEVRASISRIPGPPRGPSLRTTTTSPSRILPSINPWIASSSRLEDPRRASEGHLVLVHRADLHHRALLGEVAEQDAERAARRVRVGGGADTGGVAVLGLGELLAQRDAAHRVGFQVQQPGDRRELAEDRGNATGVVHVLHVPLPVAVPRRGDLGQVRHTLGHLVEAGERIVDAGLAGEGQHMQHGVGRSAHRHVEGDGVVDRLRGDDVAEGDAVVDQLHDRLRGADHQLAALGGDGEDRPVAGQRDPQRLAEAVHRVGGEHPAAAAAGWAAVDLQLLESRVVDGAGGALAHPLEDGDEVHLLPLGVAAGAHRAAGDEDGREVGARRAHQHPRDDLVAIGNADHPVEAVRAGHRLDAVGDQLARREGEVHPLVPHHDPVVDADGVELERDGAGGADRVLHGLRQRRQVHVPRHDVGVRVAHGDEGLVEVLRVADLPRGAEERAVRRAGEALLDRVRSHAGRVAERGNALESAGSFGCGGVDNEKAPSGFGWGLTLLCGRRSAMIRARRYVAACRWPDPRTRSTTASRESR